MADPEQVLREEPAPPLVTALIVTRNQVEGARALLASLRQSELRERLEVLVVDKGSTDGSARLDEEFDDVTVLRLAKDFGRTRAWNIGSRTAKGEYLWLMEPTVVLAPDTLPRLLEHMTTANGVCPLVVDEQGQPVTTVQPLPTPDSLYADWRAGAYLQAQPAPHSGGAVRIEWPHDTPLLVRRDFIRGMNFIDQRYGEFGPELEVSHQLRTSGKPLLLATDVTVRGTAAPTGDDALHHADRAHGSAVYVAKRHGFAAGLKFRLRAALAGVGDAITFRHGGFGEFTGLLTGRKVDGT